MGLNFNSMRSDATALFLSDETGEYSLPIIIGTLEAQAIGFKIKGVVTPRPLTHDLFCTFIKAYDIQLIEVFIYKFEDGIFCSRITFRDKQGVEVVIDSRTSDAVALALRVDAPMYTTREILERAGMTLEECIAHGQEGFNFGKGAEDDVEDDEDDEELDPEDMSIEELRARIAELTEEENYEEAARLSEVLRRRCE